MSNDKAGATYHGMTHRMLRDGQIACGAQYPELHSTDNELAVDCPACTSVSQALFLQRYQARSLKFAKPPTPAEARVLVEQFNSSPVGQQLLALQPTGEHVKDKLDDGQEEYRERYMFDRPPGVRPAFFPLSPAEILMGVGIVLAIVIVFSFIVLAY